MRWVNTIFAAGEKSTFLISIFILLFGGSSCQRKEPPVYLFRYHHQPGDILRYDISLKGKGEIKLATAYPGQPAQEMVIPVQIKGKLVLQAAAKNVSENGIAELNLVYKDFDFEITNQLGERELKIILNDERMQTTEGGKVLKEVRQGEDGFPLNDLLKKTFTVEVDERGRITRVEAPPDPNRSFPYLNFKDLWEQIQPEFPAQTVRIGEGWTKEVELTMPGLGRPWDKGESWEMELNWTFRGFEGGDEQVALIDLSGQLEQKWEEEDEEESSSGVKSSLHKLRSEVGFDLKEGKVLFSHSSLEQEFNIRMDINRIAKEKSLDVHITFIMDIDAKLQNIKEDEGG